MRPLRLGARADRRPGGRRRARRSIRGPGRLSSGGAWAIVDQGASSASNLLLVATVARVSDVAGFGRFSLVYLIYGLALGSLRAGGGDVLLLRAHERQRPISHESRRLLGVALWTGAAIGLVLGGVELAAGASVDSVGVALAAVLPVLLLQDALRYAFFALATPRRAAFSDLLWLAVQIVLTVLLFALPIGPDPQIVVLAWGAGALVSAIAGCLAVRLTPIITGAASWMADDRARVGSFLGDFVMLSGSNYLAMYLVVAFATVRAVAAVRGSAFLFSPLDALFLGIRIFALPALARAAATGEAAIRRVAELVAVGSAAITAVAALILVSLPDDLGRAVMGATWTVAQPLIALSAVAAAARYVALPAQAGLRALNDPRRIVGLRLTVTVFVLLGAGVGTLAAGATGAVLGLAVAFSLDAIISWRVFGSSCRQAYARA